MAHHGKALSKSNSANKNIHKNTKSKGRVYIQLYKLKELIRGFFFRSHVKALDFKQPGRNTQFCCRGKKKKKKGIIV